MLIASLITAKMRKIQCALQIIYVCLLMYLFKFQIKLAGIRNVVIQIIFTDFLNNLIYR
jgi:hypothetical protein